MIEIFNRNNDLIVSTSKKELVFDTISGKLVLEDFDFSYPGEYEKSGILVEVKEHGSSLFYNLLIDGNHIVFVTSDSFEINEEILSFFGDIDILIIAGTKQSTKIVENLESRVVIPYGENKNLFLNTLGQHIDEANIYKVKSEKSLDSTEFVNLS